MEALLLRSSYGYSGDGGGKVGGEGVDGGTDASFQLWIFR